MAASLTKKPKKSSKKSKNAPVKKFNAKQKMLDWGWEEGKGIGKNHQGRKSHIRVSMKMDKHGLGTDPTKNAVDPWWAKAFNRTAKKIRRKNKNDSDSEVSSDSESSDSSADQNNDQDNNEAKFDDCGRKINSKRA